MIEREPRQIQCAKTHVGLTSQPPGTVVAGLVARATGSHSEPLGASQLATDAATSRTMNRIRQAQIIFCQLSDETRIMKLQLGWRPAPRRLLSLPASRWRPSRAARAHPPGAGRQMRNVAWAHKQVVGTHILKRRCKLNDGQPNLHHWTPAWSLSKPLCASLAGAARPLYGLSFGLGGTAPATSASGYHWSSSWTHECKFAFRAHVRPQVSTGQRVSALTWPLVTSLMRARWRAHNVAETFCRVGAARQHLGLGGRHRADNNLVRLHLAGRPGDTTFSLNFMTKSHNSGRLRANAA